MRPIYSSTMRYSMSAIPPRRCDHPIIRTSAIPRAICDTAVQQRYAMYYHRYHPPSTTANHCQAMNRDTQEIAVQPATLRTAKHTTRRIRDKAIQQYNLQHHPPNSQYASDTAVQPRITTLRYPYSTACSDTTQPLRCARSCTRNGQQYSRELQRYATHTVQHVAIPPSRYQLHAQRQKKRSSGDSV